jgi:hypothetical protein
MLTHYCFDRGITVTSYRCNILEYYLLVRLFCNFDTSYMLYFNNGLRLTTYRKTTVMMVCIVLFIFILECLSKCSKWPQP